MKRMFSIIPVISFLFLSCKKDATKGDTSTVPLVTTAELTNIGNSSATAGGKIVSDGGFPVTKAGLVWSRKNDNPSLTDSVINVAATNGPFTADITGFDLNTTYYVRAYATNSQGTGYGNVVTLKVSGETVSFTYNGQQVTYGVVVSPVTGRKWLDRNLGAKRVATAFDDHQAYGDLFQWGRPADGHQLMNWASSTAGAPVNGATTTKATSDVPGHANYIIMSSTAANGDWRNDNNRNRWNTNPQGPCPAGWHVPTVTEWGLETNIVYWNGPSNGFKDRGSAYSILRLTTAGIRQSSDGQLMPDGSNNVPGNIGHYWASTDETNGDPPFTQTVGRDLSFGINGINILIGLKSEGKSVRCIKD